MLFLKSHFGILASLVTLGVATSSHHLAYKSPLSHHTRSFKSSNAEVEVCGQLGNCLVKGGSPVYSLDAISKRSKRSVDSDLIKRANSTLPTDAKEDDLMTLIFVGGKAQDSGTLDFSRMVRESLDSVSKGAGFKKVDPNSTFNSGYTLVVNEEKNQTLITQCSFKAGKDWSTNFPQVEAPLEQALVGAVYTVNEIATLPGPAGNSCDPHGNCMKVKDGDDVDRSFGPSSMKSLLLTFRGSSWIALGYMEYSMHCVKDTELTCKASKSFNKDVKDQIAPAVQEGAGKIKVLC